MSFLERWRREKAKNRAKKKKAENHETIVGVAWFTEEEWKRLTEIVPDRSALDDTFQDWERNAQATLKKFQARGITGVPVMVTAAELQAWCEKEGRQVDGEARAEYASHLLRSNGRGPDKPGFSLNA